MFSLRIFTTIEACLTRGRDGAARLAPEKLFLWFASLGGLALLALIPPLAGGNETFNFQRTASIAAFHPLIEPAQTPLGVATLLDAAHGQFPTGGEPPYHYAFTGFRELAAIPLGDGVTATLIPNAITVLHPVAYIPQVAAFWLGQALGLSPLALFYLGRIAGLGGAIGLTFLAIRLIPVHKWSLCALALLPTILFTRTTLDADQVTNAATFLFSAATLRAAMGAGRLGAGAIAALAALAFVTAQCKTAYFPLTLLALAVPVARYGSRRRWALGSLAIVAPGMAASLAWMIALKMTFFAGLKYRTWAGLAFPDAQTALILAHPLDFAMVLARTLFATPLLATAALGVLGVFGPPVNLPLIDYLLLALTLSAVLLGEGADHAPPAGATLRRLATGIFLVVFLLLLTLIYIQWTGVGDEIVQGFSGRYLIPLLPPLLLLLPRARGLVLRLDTPVWTALLGALSLVFTLWTTWTTYWA